MRHFTSRRFWQCFESLPVEVQELAKRSFEQLKENPAHPSLHFKSLHAEKFYSVRIGLHYRALGVSVPEGVQWFWIGTHAQYDRLVGK